MVRTRAGPTKVSAGKAPAKQRIIAAVSESRGSPSRSNKAKEVHGNSYHPRETPGWQKPIKSFFQCGSTDDVILEHQEDSSTLDEPCGSSSQCVRSSRSDVDDIVDEHRPAGSNLDEPCSSGSVSANLQNNDNEELNTNDKDNHEDEISLNNTSIN